jgi:hypothetical protein
MSPGNTLKDGDANQSDKSTEHNCRQHLIERHLLSATIGRQMPINGLDNAKPLDRGFVHKLGLHALRSYPMKTLIAAAMLLAPTSRQSREIFWISSNGRS